MTESEAKLIESMADDYSNVLKEAKSMGCNEIKALYNIPLKNMEMIVQALEKQIAMKPIRHIAWQDFKCPACGSTEIITYDTEYREYDKDYKFEYCSDCGQKLDWS